MQNNKCFSQSVSVFHNRKKTENGLVVGYGAVIKSLELPLPLPQRLALISEKNRKYENDFWLVFTPRYCPEETLYAHLVFALKYEGVNLLFFKKLFDTIENSLIIEWINKEPQSQYVRKIWFLYEWLRNEELSVSGLKSGNYVKLINEKHQFSISEGINSSRHRIENNLPGTIDFCPLIFKTPKIIAFELSQKSFSDDLFSTSSQKTLLQRASAFLMLKDSKASFDIEGETPTHQRALNWGKVIGEAGAIDLTKAELERLQKIIIDNSKFLKYGYRTQQGFVGEHDRDTFIPIPKHVSAKWQDLNILMDGLLKTMNFLEEKSFSPILSAAKIAFGFVFIHPFVDGNGRLHRFLIHHIFAKTNFTPQSVIFPISAAILEDILIYRSVLQMYSKPILDFIEWEKTKDNNIEILNESIDFYRYFDATPQAEFLCQCVEKAINIIIPNEINFLKNYDDFKNYLENNFKMPDKKIALMTNFLEQNNGFLSKRAKKQEFEELNDVEISQIEIFYKSTFLR